MKVDVPKLVDAIKSCLPARRPIHHHEPFINPDQALPFIDKALRLGVGNNAFLDTFADYVRDVTNSEQVILTSSGTAALQVALTVIGVKPGEEVIVPSMTFVATANAVAHIGAIPHFIDGATTIKASRLRQYLEKNTNPYWNKKGRINKQTGRRISALVVVDLLGMPADWVGIRSVSDEFGLEVIEDACQAFGSKKSNIACGTFATIGVISFNNNKIVTTNGGGAILTNDPYLAARAALLATTARKEHPWLVEHDSIAWNYRMGSINAALGVAQMKNFTEILAYKKKLFELYLEKIYPFIASGQVVGLLEPNLLTKPCEPNYWLNTLLVDPSQRDEILTELHKEGIFARAVFTPLHTLPMYKDNPRSDSAMSECISYHGRAICLPSGVGLI